MSSDPSVTESGPSEGGEADGHGEGPLVTYRGQVKEITFILDLNCRMGRGGGSQRNRLARSQKEKKEQAKSEKAKKSVGIIKKKKAQHMKASAPGEGSSASPAEPINTPPPPVRFPPFAKSGTARDVVKWSMKCRKIGKQAAKDPRLNLPTMRKPKDSETTEAVQSPKDKKMVMDASSPSPP